MSTVLVTGANGYIGRNLCPVLESLGHTVRPVQRNVNSATIGSAGIYTGDIDEADLWPARHFEDLDIVVHLAACVHRRFSREQMYRTNLDGTLALARRSMEAGVTQFVFLSTVAAIAPSSSPMLINEFIKPAPISDYGRSKLEAEKRLMRLTQDKQMAVTVLRPPMVYGRKCPGNFTALARLIRSGLPLPFGSVSNKRSLISIENLCDAIVHCIGQRRAYNQCFCVADSEAVATPELIRMMAAAMGQPAHVFRFPPGFLKTLAALAVQRRQIESLCGSLELDISFARRQLEWSPPVTLAEGIERSF